MIKLTFKLRPLAKQSARFSRGVTYTPLRLKHYERDIMFLAKEQLPPDFTMIEEGPLEVIVEYRFKKKKIKVDAYRTIRPDIDSNINKGLFDALEGVVWSNDAIVSRITATKLWSFEDRIDVIIRRINVPYSESICTD